MREFRKILNTTSLDEVGLTKSLKRFENESMYHYKRRIEIAASEAPDQQFESVSKYSNLALGQIEKKILRIEKKKDNIFPRIKVDCCFVYLYKSKLDGSNELINKWNYLEDLRYVKDLILELNKYDFIKVSLPLEEDISYLEVKNLKIQDSMMRREREALTQKPINRLENKNIIDFIVDQERVFRNEVNSPSFLKTQGDYYFDKEQGKIISYMNPIGTISYTYYEDEFYLIWQPIKVWLLNDDSMSSRLKEERIVKGKKIRSVLNEEGCELINRSLVIDPINWGE